MSETSQFEQLRRAILRQARQEAQQVLEQAEAQADALLQCATAQAEQEAQQQLAAHHQQLAQATERATAQAELEARLFLLEQREFLLDEVLARAREQLASVATWPTYPELAVQLAREAIAQLHAPEVILETDPQAQHALDFAVLEALGAEFGVAVTLGPPLSEGLGVVAHTPDGHRRYDNTLAARLERLYPQLRPEIYALLAGDK